MSIIPPGQPMPYAHVLLDQKNSRHTPGPWQVARSQSGGFFVQGDLGGETFELVFACEDARRADLHLIQQAPALLLVAKMAVHFTRAMSHKLHGADFERLASIGYAADVTAHHAEGMEI